MAQERLKKDLLVGIWRYNGEIIVTMHDLIENMRKEIVRQQLTCSEKCNRLWFYEDIIPVHEKIMVCNRHLHGFFRFLSLYEFFIRIVESVLYLRIVGPN